MTLYLTDEAVSEILRWWRALHPDGHHHDGDRGQRAQLRRADGPLEALLLPSTLELISRVTKAQGAAWPRGKSAASAATLRLAGLAILLASARPGDPAGGAMVRFADLLGTPASGSRSASDEPPRYSPLRFSALLRAGDDPDQFVRQARRAIAIAGRTPFQMPDFIRSVAGFDDEVRRRWTFEYCGHGSDLAADASASAEATEELEEN
ncbi:MAG: type I-E CRISPR-associated protein Cse2/CasB [Pannonibacter sp.]